jgi:hypothetical protein
MADPKKLDLYKEHKAEYVPAKSPVLVKVGPAKYLCVEGRGAPAGEQFTAAVGALYASAFTIKMTRKFAGKGDYKVCNLEGLWWTDRVVRSAADLPPRDQWQWKLLIRVPDFIKPADLKAALASLAEKGKSPRAAIGLETIREGTCVQMLHVGAYADEPRTVAAMETVMKESGLEFKGPHHEIYLSDPRRVGPERLRTILRHPARRAGGR